VENSRTIRPQTRSPLVTKPRAFMAVGGTLLVAIAIIVTLELTHSGGDTYRGPLGSNPNGPGYTSGTGDSGNTGNSGGGNIGAGGASAGNSGAGNTGTGDTGAGGAGSAGAAGGSSATGTGGTGSGNTGAGTSQLGGAGGG